MSNLNGGLSGSGLLRGALGGGGVAPPQDVYWDDILDKPDFATVATSGSYNDLTDKPTIPAAQVNADWNATSGVAEILNKPTLATVATSGSYNDLTDTPTIPPAQVNADWNATSGVAEILNKPTIPTTASQIEYDNTTSGLTATDTQEAIDENAAEITTIKSNLIDLLNLSKPLETISYTASVYHCTGTITNIPTIQRVVGTNYFTIDGRLAITSFTRSGGNPGITITLPSDIIPTESQSFTVGVRSEYPRELFSLSITSNSNILSLVTSEAFANATNGTLTAVIPRIIFYIKF